MSYPVLTQKTYIFPNHDQINGSNPRHSTLLESWEYSFLMMFYISGLVSLIKCQLSPSDRLMVGHKGITLILQIEWWKFAHFLSKKFLFNMHCYAQLCLNWIPGNLPLWIPVSPVSLWFGDIQSTTWSCLLFSLLNMIQYIV